jgi:hypothetical protein
VQAAPTTLVTAMLGLPAVGSGALPALARNAITHSRRATAKMIAATACSILTIIFVAHRVGSGRWLGFTGQGRLNKAQIVQQPPKQMNTETNEAGDSGANGATPPSGPGFLFRVIAAEDGRGIPGAKVVADQVIGDQFFIESNWHRGKDQVTDAEGYCTVPLESGLSRLDVGALKDGFEQKSYTWWKDSEEQLPPFYVLKLGRAVTIGGHVQDKAGEPITGAGICVFFHGTGDSTDQEPKSEGLGFRHEVVVTQTDHEGNWHCAITPPGYEHISISVQHPKFALKGFGVGTDSKGAIAPADLWAQKAVMVLEPGFEVRGFVLDEKECPLAGARVSRVARHVNYNYTQAEVQTASDGSFSINGLTAGSANLSAWFKGLAPSLIVTEIGPNTPSVVFRLGAGLQCPIRIVDEEGEPIAGARLCCRCPCRITRT